MILSSFSDCPQQVHWSTFPNLPPLKAEFCRLLWNSVFKGLLYFFTCYWITGHCFLSLLLNWLFFVSLNLKTTTNKNCRKLLLPGMDLVVDKCSRILSFVIHLLSPTSLVRNCSGILSGKPRPQMRWSPDVSLSTDHTVSSSLRSNSGQGVKACSEPHPLFQF